MNDSFAKHRNILAGILIVSTCLVATHEGEFWPFSIFPMFSQAGKEWSRGVIEQVDDSSAISLWQVKPLEDIDNRILPLKEYGIHEIDFANYINKTSVWNEERLNGLRSTFQIDHHPGKMWMATRVSGHLSPDRKVEIRTIPLILFTADTTIVNPQFTLN